MSGDVVIRAEGLGKKYLIGHQTEARATTLREALGRSARGLARSAGAMMKGRPLVAGDAVEEFWALKDVSFEVKRGEVVGVIGRNGAGKSTLLKILSRITEPTEGRVAIKGRVASLLEVGTGFHPELTGRENIFLNGAILGMTRAEIRRKFDEIVDFAGIEKFLDTPVKRYSSGMYVRLAFAVAAHLEPEILIVDEVLAVGDAEFQKKCLGKMQDVAGHGKTVLFVSHQIGAVERLCTKSIFLEGGAVNWSGDVSVGISKYMLYQDEREGAWVPVLRDRVAASIPDTAAVEKVRSRIERTPDGRVLLVLAAAGRRYDTSITSLRLSFTIVSASGVPVGSVFGDEVEFKPGKEFEILSELPVDILAPGLYFVALSIGRGNLRGVRTNYQVISPLVSFRVAPLSGAEGSYTEWRDVWGSMIFRDASFSAIECSGG